MSTLRIHAPAQPKIVHWVHDAMTHVVKVARIWREAYAEAQELQRQADKRYPFTYWC